MKNRIGELRREKGLTLKEMGTLLNIRDNTLSQYETGKREPQLGLMVEIANFFGVSLEYLFGETDVRDYPTTNNEECITLLKMLQSDEITYSNISLKSSLNLAMWVSQNGNLLESYEDSELLQTAFYFLKYVQSEAKALNWFTKERISTNETINEIFNLLEFEDDGYYGARPKDVLRFMKESERINYKEIKSVLKYMESIPDAEQDNY